MKKIHCKNCKGVVSSYWERPILWDWILWGVGAAIIVILEPKDMYSAFAVFTLFYVSTLVVMYFRIPFDGGDEPKES